MHTGLDLNLLVVFNAIYEHNSLTQAGRMLNLSQSAVSHALSRLRDAMDDPLFVRKGNSMEPTAAAHRMHPDISRALELMQRTIPASQPFEPEKASRTFTIGMSDYSALLLLPSLLSLISKEAPGIRLRTVHTQPYERRATMLTEGQVDMYVGCDVVHEESLERQFLFSDKEVCVVHKDHPHIGKALTMEEFLRQSFISLSLSETGIGFIEQTLHDKGVARKIMVTVQQETSIPYLAATTTHVGTMGERLARLSTATLPVRLLPIPELDTSFDVFLFWHKTRTDDPAHRWLRTLFTKASNEL